MSRRLILTVLGARPQFVKAAVVSRAIARLGSLEERLVHTGQHYDAEMSSVFFEELGIPPPAFSLGIGGGTHGENTGRAVEAVERLVLRMKPDWLMVYGDTDSTLAGALAAAKLCVPVVHVEAGLRSFNRAMPEEINRVLTDHVSALLFAPSGVAVQNLAREGIAGDHVVEVGDVMLDAVRQFSAVATEKSVILDRLALPSRRYVLATLHRKENVDDPHRLSRILDGLRRSEMDIVLPLHPRTRKRLEEFGIRPAKNIRIIEPVGYLDMMQLESNAAAIATDSGGVQKEAFFHHVPALILRDETEWVELIEIGANRLVGADPERIAEALASLPDDVPAASFYGDGEASLRIAQRLADG